ncbi:hypothetical protein LR48_Vigan01g194100 [Vigna angularis]|uniref:Uncharacterized protein n=1 Tax=Phaseolus angularis TaxID=3914 RepID=A0A0L9TP97_PHAAN|nr:hypothetical protein LR48_Vigan01g194100 [Vigna angularis]
MFPKLTYLNLAWTSVTKLPTLSSLEWLDMSNCTIDSILEDDKYPLAKLIFSGATFLNESGVFSYANTNLVMHDGGRFVEMVACVGANLKSLNLCGTRVSSAGLGILAGHVPNLEILSLSQTPLDDTGISFISMMPSLKDVHMSNTYVKACEGDEARMLFWPFLRPERVVNGGNVEYHSWNITVAGPLKQNKILSYNAETKTSKIHRYVGAQEELTQLRLSKAEATVAAVDCYKTSLEAYGAWTVANGAGQRKTVLERHQQLRRSTQRRNEGPTMRNVRRDEDALKTDEDGSNGCSGRSEQREGGPARQPEASRFDADAGKAARDKHAPEI